MLSKLNLVWCLIFRLLKLYWRYYYHRCPDGTERWLFFCMQGARLSCDTQFAEKRREEKRQGEDSAGQVGNKKLRRYRKALDHGGGGVVATQEMIEVPSLCRNTIIFSAAWVSRQQWSGRRGKWQSKWTLDFLEEMRRRGSNSCCTMRLECGCGLSRGRKRFWARIRRLFINLICCGCKIVVRNLECRGHRDYLIMINLQT